MGQRQFPLLFFFHRHLEIINQSIKPTTTRLSYIFHYYSISRDTLLTQMLVYACVTSSIVKALHRRYAWVKVIWPSLRKPAQETLEAALVFKLSGNDGDNSIKFDKDVLINCNRSALVRRNAFRPPLRMRAVLEGSKPFVLK